jgi:anti-anti-sigma regulatory factor
MAGMHAAEPHLEVPFNITVEAAPDQRRLRVTVAGALDSAAAPALLESVNLNARGDYVILDLATVTFIDSSGVLALITIRERFGDRLRIIPNPSAIRLFRLAD